MAYNFTFGSSIKIKVLAKKKIQGQEPTITNPSYDISNYVIKVERLLGSIFSVIPTIEIVSTDLALGTVDLFIPGSGTNGDSKHISMESSLVFHIRAHHNTNTKEILLIGSIEINRSMPITPLTSTEIIK